MPEESSLNESAVRVLGNIPSGLFILTASHDEHSTGMLASWVMQAGFDPPRVTVAVKLGRPLCDWLTDGTPFALHLLGEDDSALLKHFARGFEPGQPAFEDLEVSQRDDGVPVLASAAGYLVCTPTGHHDSGDHRVFFASVTDGEQTRESRPWIHIRKSGLSY
ncbi:MAG: flavin reductase family protein [Pirellulales bacterium]|nr:flavin reductase family protein [Pirellulales bacterium]